MTSLIGFVIALGILVTVHEWGHYRVALACRIRVLRFSIGFGRPLVRWVRPQKHFGTDIEFVIGAIPLGGYVKLLDGREDELPQAEQHGAFDRQPLASRVAVVLAGPLANFVLAFVLYAWAFAMGSWQLVPSVSVPVAGSVAERAGIRGGEVVRAAGNQADDLRDIASLEEWRNWLMVQSPDQPIHLQLVDTAGRHLHDVTLEPTPSAEARAPFLSPEVLGLAMPQTEPVLRELVPQGAAARAGLAKGDRVLSIDGRRVVDAAQLKRMVRDSGASGRVDPQVWRILRDGVEMAQVVVLDVVSDGPVSVGRIGALLGSPTEKVWVAYGPTDAITKAWASTWDMTALTWHALVRMVMGASSWDNLGGPIAIAEMAGQSLQVGAHAFLVYLALLSVSLGVFNLLPIPALDGGHLLYYLYEFLLGKAPDARWVQAFQQAGFLALMALTAVALFNDLHRLGG